ncbi:MAG TPA: N-(5'-phosphoribosyl)anthranilate isomerase, partial [Acidobacteria bacterium]|nr:N-(5'-phosphoribosyl)anthranilate isomerase [Acidobacteriota bacterium]
MFVKVCGITREEDALLATALGADAVGFVFAPSSRQVAVPIVRDIVRQLPADMMTVGVFRNESARRVVEVVNEIGLRAAQLHGNETPEDCRWISERIPVTIRALAVGSPDLDYFDEFGADLLLLDSPVPGSGEVFDWSLAEGAPDNRKMILAGGLDPT